MREREGEREREREMIFLMLHTMSALLSHWTDKQIMHSTVDSVTAESVRQMAHTQCHVIYISVTLPLCYSYRL